MKRWPYPRIFAHRGGGSLAPENTLAAFRLGQSLGYAAHEFDVKLSKDGVAILLHDPTLERTTNGKGRAADITWDELRGLDAGGWHSEPFRGEPVPSFEEVARLLRSKGTLANVEIKPTPGFERETGERVAQFAARLWQGAAVPPLRLVVLVRGADGREVGRARASARMAREPVRRGGLGEDGGARGRVGPHEPHEARPRQHREGCTARAIACSPTR